MYKKILSITLVLLMICSCVGVSVSAYTPSLESLFKNAFIRYNEKQGASVDEETLYIRHIGNAGDYDVYRAYYGPFREVESEQIIGNYIFTYNVLVGDEATNPTGLYAYNGVELMTLKEANDKDLVDLDELYAEASKKDGIIPLGETDKLELMCKTAYIEKYNIAGDAAENCDVTFAIKYENYTVFRVYPFAVLPMESFQYMDGYWFWEGNIIGGDNNPTGLYTLDNYGNVESLYETVNKSFIDLKELYPTLSEVAPMYISGDIDSDKRLTVKDATLIQKYLAKIPEAVEKVYNHNLGYCVMETDEPWGASMFKSYSKVNVKDATYIQKKVAKMIFDEETQPFYKNYIVAWVLDEAKEYTLEDFPEYAFERIEQNGSCILLHLKNPGKTNVINAVNALEYREGADLADVTAEYIPTEGVEI